MASLGESNWIDQQFRKRPLSLAQLLHDGANHYNNAPHQHGVSTNISNYRGYAWWESVMTGDDPLRERVAYALSQIFVISDVDSNVNYWSNGAAAYYDLLTKDAFGNYRDLMTDVTLNPMMGLYLTYLYNVKADPDTGTHPDENYARELMQLFTIGLYQLNQDGTLQLDGTGQPIPTYGNAEVTNFARVYTGLSLGGPRISFYGQQSNYEIPMSFWDEYHDQDPKTLLVYPGSTTTNLAGGQTTRTDLANAMKNIFNHPNVGPFVSRRLIQNMVTSNPTPGYISRVAAVFNDNGRGVRGDLSAVVKAILLDDEARNVSFQDDPAHGKLREPWVRTVHLARSFQAHPGESNVSRPVLRWQLYNLNYFLGEEELRSPSVFNFFAPDYQPPGPVLDAGLVAPEFQIINASTVSTTINYLRSVADVSLDPYGTYIYLDLVQQNLLARNPLDLIDNIDLLLTGGTLSAGTRASVYNAVEQIPESKPTIRVRTALVALINSPDYCVQK